MKFYLGNIWTWVILSLLKINLIVLITGIHEIRILSERNNRDVFNTFNLNVYDSSKLKINFTEEEAIVGKTFKFSG